ncbi:MAG: GxxExxY protein [Gemmatimonadetes bacterium]|nr:GxxExxY protein [Gemmatimonadota bacterium]
MVASARIGLLDASGHATRCSMPTGLLLEDVTGDVRKAFFEVYNRLDYGFLEQVYGKALESELRAMGRHVAREVSVPVLYKGLEIATQRLDFVVDGTVIIEVKSTERLPSVAHRQVLSYLRATRLEVAMLLHFGPAPKFYRSVVSNALPPRDTP